MNEFSDSDKRAARRTLLAIAAWGASVTAASATGSISRLPSPGVAPLIVAGISLPSAIYGRSSELRHLAATIGVHTISLAHAWRIAAALVFLRAERDGALPPIFARRAGWGDLIAGVAALSLAVLPRRRSTYFLANAIGFADFVVAIVTGIRFTLRRDPLMRSIARFPLALLPLFGVGLSGTAHVIAFDLLRSEGGNERAR
jgi:hypothetical protein